MMTVTGAKVTSDRRPETTAAFLPCAGVCSADGLVATLHEFSHRLATTDETAGAKIRLWRLMFTCKACGTGRAWGNER